MRTFADHVIAFNSGLDFEGPLPPGIRIMNPYRDEPQVAGVMQQFYKRFYNDTRERRLILGINPGRLGAGATGVPFTDTKRLADELGLSIKGLSTHEPSSVFVYDVIHAYGGTKKFYGDFYIGSVCPLGFVTRRPNGSEINYNYYDSPALTKAVHSFITDSLRRQLAFGISRKVCYCMGTGKNSAFLQKLNEQEHFFDKIIPLEHPRFIMQYRVKRKQEFVDKYLESLTQPAD